MRAFFARLIQPPSCGHKIKLVMSTRHMDTYDPDTGTITPGAEYKLWQTCGLRPGHAGEHGGYQFLGAIRLRIANWLGP